LQASHTFKKSLNIEAVVDPNIYSKKVRTHSKEKDCHGRLYSQQKVGLGYRSELEIFFPASTFNPTFAFLLVP